MGDHRDVDLAGRSIRLDAVDEVADRHLRWFFGPSVRLEDGAAPDLVVRLGDDVLGGDDDDRYSTVDGPVRLWHESDRLRVRHRSGAIATATDDRIDIRRAAADEQPWRSHRHLLQATLAWWFERRRTPLLHGAAITVDRATMLVLGPTGTGKSTAVAAAAGRRADIHADDLVVVRLDMAEEAPSVACFGVPKVPAFEPALADHLAAPSEEMEQDARMRRMVPIEFDRRWHTVDHVVVVDHDEGAGIVEPLDHRHVLASLLACSPEAARPDSVARHLAVFGALASLPAWQLRHAADPDVRLQRAWEMLSSISAP